MITLPKLPYNLNDLEPHISTETMEYHYNKHLVGYVENLNKLIKGSYYDSWPLEELVKMTCGFISDNAAQVWNHNFYFESLASPELDRVGLDDITSDAETYINTHFGSCSDFVDDFNHHAKLLFGSGWVWLVHTRGKGKIICTDNANNPLMCQDTIPLLVWDCWEHNYYIDHRNDRKSALTEFWKVVNWNKVSERIGKLKT